jgi:putative endonuclease
VWDCVYILSSRSRRLYVGSTTNLAIRLRRHRQGAVPFTAKYRIHRLVYFERAINRSAAVIRENQIKSWRRARKIQLIVSLNPAWNDLSAVWIF